MDQILQNSYFNKISKDKYSFPKSDRFPQLKTKYTIDYYQSSSIAKPRQTSFGFGSKYDFFKNVKKGPGPFQYQYKDQNRVTRGLSFGQGREDIKAGSYIDSQKIKTPRAGQVKYSISQYNANYLKTKKREPSCYILGRRPSDSFIQPDHNPEPSKYNPDDKFYSRRKKSSQFAFGSAKRFDYGENHTNKLIGPGSYTISPRNKSKLGTIGQADRKTYAVQSIQSSITPGPKYFVQ